MTVPPLQPVPSWWQMQLEGIEKYGIAHWTYIVTFVIGALIGHFV